MILVIASNNDHRYTVFNADGSCYGTYIAQGGGGSVNNMYFDWSAGRYQTYDGYGNRQGGTSTVLGAQNDAFTYTYPSPNHVCQ